MPIVIQLNTALDAEVKFPIQNDNSFQKLKQLNTALTVKANFPNFIDNSSNNQGTRLFFQIEKDVARNIQKLVKFILTNTYKCDFLFFYVNNVFIHPMTTPIGSSAIKLVIALVRAYKNCERRPYCRSTPLGIGYSFQLAITAPRLNLIGYGIATAQS